MIYKIPSPPVLCKTIINSNKLFSVNQIKCGKIINNVIGPAIKNVKNFLIFFFFN